MAVFKVISVPQKYADEDAYADLIHYCIRPMKTPGNFIDGFGVLPQLAAEQMQIVSHAYRQDHGIRLRHWIISFEKDEIPGRLACQSVCTAGMLVLRRTLSDPLQRP